MEANRRKTMELEDGDLHQQVTYVRPQATELDERGLRRVLKAKVFDKYTVRKLDRKALERAMDNGEVDPRLVLQYAKLVDRHAYLKYSEKKVTDGEA